MKMIDYIIKADFLILRKIDLDFLKKKKKTISISRRHDKFTLSKKYSFQRKQTTTASLVGLLARLWYIRRAVRRFNFRKVRSFKSLLTSDADKCF